MPRQAGKRCRCSDQRLVPWVGGDLPSREDAISSAIAMPHHRGAGDAGRKRRGATRCLQPGWHDGQRQEQKLRSSNPAQTMVQLSNHATAILGEYTSEARTSSLQACQNLEWAQKSVQFRSLASSPSRTVELLLSVVFRGQSGGGVITKLYDRLGPMCRTLSPSSFPSVGDP